MKNFFLNAQEAFLYYYDFISKHGVDRYNTKAIFNVGFYIANPSANKIDVEWRGWSEKYANREWDWYLMKDRSAVGISKFAPIWKNMMDEKGEVNSNYGWQWNRTNQIKYVIDELTENPTSRRACITILDVKDRLEYDFKKDTPCTYAINFRIVNGKLDMSVMMRSNDLWYGFCNDQFCFSKLHSQIAHKLKLPLGSYFHFTNDLHIYYKQLNLKP